jgi:predicted ATPase
MAEDLARAGIVVTGGPGAGKTTLIGRLAARGARLSGSRSNGDALS